MHAAFSRMATPMQKSVLGLLVESTAQAEQLRATLDQITDEATAKQIIGMFVDKDVVQGFHPSTNTGTHFWKEDAPADEHTDDTQLILQGGEENYLADESDDDE